MKRCDKSLGRFTKSTLNLTNSQSYCFRKWWTLNYTIHDPVVTTRWKRNGFVFFTWLTECARQPFSALTVWTDDGFDVNVVPSCDTNSNEYNMFFFAWSWMWTRCISFQSVMTFIANCRNKEPLMIRHWNIFQILFFNK